MVGGATFGEMVGGSSKVVGGQNKVVGGVKILKKDGRGVISKSVVGGSKFWKKW